MNVIGNLTQDTESDAGAVATADGNEHVLAGSLHFEEGLFGFPECRAFSLFRTGHPGLFWLQSAEHAPLRLLLADPFVFFDGYSVELADADVRRLAPEEPSDVAILTTVTIGDTRDAGNTANLQGPIAINVQNGRARQFIVNEAAGQVRQAIDLARGLS